jgi:hypothetical protein
VCIGFMMFTLFIWYLFFVDSAVYVAVPFRIDMLILNRSVSYASVR